MFWQMILLLWLPLSQVPNLTKKTKRLSLQKDELLFCVQSKTHGFGLK